MDEYNVILLPRALQDIDDIYSYIANNFSAPETAKGMVDMIEKAVLSLSFMPYRGIARSRGLFSSKGYRQIFVKNYTIVYRIEEQEKKVFIIAVRYSRSIS